MRIIATLTVNGQKETMLEGNADIFDDESSYHGNHRRLASIGFWLTDWKYCQAEAKPHKTSHVFVPWTSCLMVEAFYGDKVNLDNLLKQL